MIYRPRFTYHGQEERETSSPNKSTIFEPESGPLDILQLKPKLPVHLPISPPIAYPWHEPNQPAFTLKDLQQLLDHLPITPLPKLPTPEQEPREAPFPKPPTPEQEPELTVIIPRNLLQMLNQLPISPALRNLLQNAHELTPLPTQEPRETPLHLLVSLPITPLPITNPPREPIVNPPIPITPLPIIEPHEREQITSLPIELPRPTLPIIFTPRDLLQPLPYFLAQEQELRPPTFTPQDLLQLTY
jgi:hypothetical protein